MAQESSRSAIETLVHSERPNLVTSSVSMPIVAMGATEIVFVYSVGPHTVRAHGITARGHILVTGRMLSAARIGVRAGSCSSSCRRTYSS